MAQKIVIVAASGKTHLLDGDTMAEQYAAAPLPGMLADGWTIRSVTSFGGAGGDVHGSVAVLLEKELSSGAKNLRGLADQEGAERPPERSWTRRM